MRRVMSFAINNTHLLRGWTHGVAVVEDELEDEAAVDEREAVAHEERQTRVELLHGRVAAAVVNHLSRQHSEQLADVIQEVTREAVLARLAQLARAIQILGHCFDLRRNNWNFRLMHWS